MIVIKLCMFSSNFAYTIMSDIQSFNSVKNPLIINLKGQLEKPFYFFLRCQTPRNWLPHLLVNTTWFSVAEELVNSTAIKDHSNMLKPYMEVLNLLVLHVPPEKHPTENGVVAGKL